MCSATHRHPAAARRPGPSGAHACVRGTAAAHGPRGPTRPHGLIGAAAGPHRGGCTSRSADRSCHATPARVRVARRGAAPPAASKRLEAAPVTATCPGPHLSWAAAAGPQRSGPSQRPPPRPRRTPTSRLAKAAAAHLTRVLTLAVLISYMRRTASVICRLFARVSTMKTRVLLSAHG